MPIPRLLARLEITNAQGVFDSQSTRPTRGDGLDTPRIEFVVTKTLDSSPNNAQIKIHNLSPERVAQITGTVIKRIEYTVEEQAQLAALGASSAPIELVYDNFGLSSVRLAFGYAGSDPTSPHPPLSIGFIGGSSSMRLRDDGLDSVLTIQAEDGGQLLGTSRLRKTYKRDTDTVLILADLINACGVTVDKAKLKSAMQSALLARGIPTSNLNQRTGYIAGTSTAATQITSIMNALGMHWSIQDGEFLLLDTNTVLAGYPPLILSAPDFTLFGNPEPLEAQQMLGRTWANAEARPGRETTISTAALGTQYRIYKSVSSGDTTTGGSTAVTLDELQVIPGVF